MPHHLFDDVLGTVQELPRIGNGLLPEFLRRAKGVECRSVGEDEIKNARQKSPRTGSIPKL